MTINMDRYKHYYEKNVISPVICNQCGNAYAFRWEGKYWCEECGKHAQLIKLMKLLIHKQDDLEKQISEREASKFQRAVYELIQNNFIPKLESFEKSIKTHLYVSKKTLEKELDVFRETMKQIVKTTKEKIENG